MAANLEWENKFTLLLSLLTISHYNLETYATRITQGCQKVMNDADRPHLN